ATVRARSSSSVKFSTSLSSALIAATRGRKTLTFLSLEEPKILEAKPPNESMFEIRPRSHDPHALTRLGLRLKLPGGNIQQKMRGEEFPPRLHQTFPRRCGAVETGRRPRSFTGRHKNSPPRLSMYWATPRGLATIVRWCGSNVEILTWISGSRRLSRPTCRLLRCGICRHALFFSADGRSPIAKAESIADEAHRPYRSIRGTRGRGVRVVGSPILR